MSIQSRLARAAAISTAAVAIWSSTASADTFTAQMPRGTPQWLLVPRIGVQASVEAVNLFDPAAVHAPYKWQDVAWYQSGPRPGATGRSIIFGHYDSLCCPAVFYHLRDLHKGDDLYVAYPGNLAVHFRVVWNNSYSNKALPLKWMYGAAPHDHGLILVTCSGDFHRDGSGYDHHLMVYARAVTPGQ